MNESRLLATGSTIGILGGGQLGLMMVQAARRMGYRTAVLDPDSEAPAIRAADQVFRADYSDVKAAARMAEQCSALTYEFENISLTTVEMAESLRPVFPSSMVLRACSHRIREKEAVIKAGCKVGPFAKVTDKVSLEDAMSVVNFPAVLKTAESGYDGKGQVRTFDSRQLREAFDGMSMEGREFILERLETLEKELSVIVARKVDGGKETVLTFPIAENVHTDGILDYTVAPADVSPEIAEEARHIAHRLAVSLNVRGLLTVELFLTESGKLLVNEMAPRPHNSGHYTIEACRTSQFEQLVRIIVGLPLGSVEQLRPAGMANLLGDMWLAGDNLPDLKAALSVEGSSVYIYGKSEARRGRKMGHIVATDGDARLALQKVLESRSLALNPKS